MATVGGDEGREFDDGIYDAVRKAIVGVYGGKIEYVQFEYMVHGNIVEREEHGVPPLRHIPLHLRNNVHEFVLDVENHEYLRTVQGTYDDKTGFLTSLIFHTSTGRESQKFGETVGTNSFLGKLGFQILGFHGRSTTSGIKALGAHLGPACVPPAKKLEITGLMGNPDETWDDGVQDDVRAIKVEYNRSSVRFLLIMYGSQRFPPEIIWGNHHGYTPMLHDPGSKTIYLYPDECIISMEGYYKREFPHFKTLKFKTNMGNSILGGYEEDLDGAIPFVLEENGHKIVGLYCNVDKFGVYVKPIDNA